MSEDRYAWWRAAIAGNVGPIHESRPQPGRYKRRISKGGPWVPAAIDPGENGAMVCIVDGDIRDADTEWTWLAKYPISQADYKHRVTTGVWPGEAPQIGNNRPSDPYEALVADIKEAIGSADTWLGSHYVATQADADLVGNKIGTLRELAKKATDAHKVEKAPHLEAGRVVDGKYNPLIAELTGAATKLKYAVAAWAATEQRKRDEEARKIEAERRRIEEDNRRREAEAAKANAPPPQLELVPDQPKVEKVQIGGQVGRKVGFKTVQSVIVTDYAKTLKKFKDHAEVVELIGKLANREFKATGKVLAGCELKEETIAA